MSEEKTEKPTPRKLRKARDKGEVFKSVDLTQTVTFAALLALATLGVGYWIAVVREELDAWPQRMRALADAPPGEGLALLLHATMSSGWATVVPTLVVFGAGAAVTVLVLGLQVRGIFSMEPLSPKAERLNPGANLKRLVSTRNLYDLVKVLAKVSLVGCAVYVAVKASVPDWIAYMRHGGHAAQLGVMLARTALQVALACLVIYVLFSGIDYGHQFYEYMKQQRMSKDEVRREHKEIEGDPYVKGYRRAIMRLMATEGPPRNLGNARVVVTNPTHYAVALAYDPLQGGLPSVVAKGVDRAALAIRREAQRLGIPVVEDRPLARKLFAQVAVGHFITNDTLAPVAQLMARVTLPRPATVGRGDTGVRQL